ncbi:MAG: DUF4288 domain-containing protein [Chitinophagaceae bacterium]|jgi:hypothetical protein
MKWYLAKLVFRIICGDGAHSAQFDEQLRLVSGVDKEEAYRKACEFAQREEDSFLNARRQTVRWKFINISELYQLHDLIDGAELYSRIEERDNAEHYIHSIHQKADSLLFGSSHALLKLA